MLGMAGEFTIGAAFVVVAVVLVLIAIPKHGQHPRFLRFDASMVLFPPVVMTFLAVGVALMLRAYYG